jgi:protoheme ferro-lyase
MNEYYNKYLKYNAKLLGKIQYGGHNSAVIIITRQITPKIINKLKGLLSVHIRTYIICDNYPIYSDKSLSKYIRYYPDKKMNKLGWTNHMSQERNKITAWDKGTYFAYKLNLPYVWICEDDVYWNNNEVIKQFFNIDNNADLIAYPLVNTFKDDSSWLHWEKTKLITEDTEKWSSSFNQIVRLSNRLLKKVHELSLEKKRLAFHEVMYATLCKINNYKIEYIPELYTNLKLYIIIRWNDPFTEENVNELINDHTNVLLHPVKFN